ncbi:hypothetical protein CBR_g53550 [Chara braunii]|uniref:Endonuclease/exonuclease/phosphatase domain-containing protein n=1 Tax=Chara braunii TaxID=69332 RepID=A0A388MB49_CHABU|nr:hypothetical protein CBR_g53550 [Chara braunii]|eukprot:GBG91735.1 hypothetical protein CBR_g53550 [Chara braunii]
MTVYAPTRVGERAKFFARLMLHVPKADRLLLAGDWNVSLDEALRPGAPTTNRGDVRTVLEFIAEMTLVDPFPILNPDDPGYTWTSHLQRDRQTVTRRRLDYFLLSEQVMDRVTSVRHFCHPISDHKPVVVDLRLSLGCERGRGFFRLNSQVLRVLGVGEWVKDHMTRWEGARHLLNSNAEWLDGGLAITSGVLDVISRILARTRNKREANCMKKVEEAEDRMEGQPISRLVWASERERRLAEWDNIQEEKQKQWTEVLKVKGIETHDKMTKETFQKLQPSRLQQQMIELKHPFVESAPPACSATGMLQYARMYYEDILTSRRPQDGVNVDLSSGTDMWDSTTVKLHTSAKLNLDRPFTVEELSQALKSMVKGKSPGVDGLPVEFYAANWGCLARVIPGATRRWWMRRRGETWEDFRQVFDTAEGYYKEKLRSGVGNDERKVAQRSDEGGIAKAL